MAPAAAHGIPSHELLHGKFRFWLIAISTRSRTVLLACVPPPVLHYRVSVLHLVDEVHVVTPTMTFRVRYDRQEDVREVVNTIKNDPELTASLLEFIHTRSAGGHESEASQNLGPFRSDAAALSFLVSRLRAALRPEAIFRFGSRAADAERPDSDFDLLVVLPDGETGLPDYFAAYAPVAGCGLGVDVVPCRTADFEADRYHPGTISFAADQEGRLVYARPGGPFRQRYYREQNVE